MFVLVIVRSSSSIPVDKPQHVYINWKVATSGGEPVHFIRLSTTSVFLKFTCEHLSFSEADRDVFMRTNFRNGGHAGLIHSEA